MFDIGFGELLLVFVIGLIVLGPQRLPHAVKTVVGWIRAVRSLAANVQSELAQELKLQELQDSLKKVEEASHGTLSPELKESMEALRKTADSMKRSVQQSIDIEREEDEANTIHSPLHQTGSDSPKPVTPAASEQQAQSPAHAPFEPHVDAAVAPAQDSNTATTPIPPRPASGYASAPPQSPGRTDAPPAEKTGNAAPSLNPASPPSASDER